MALAKQLQVPFIDTDAWIEAQEKRSISAIFQDEGEAYFRTLEKQCIDELPVQTLVVACGGGLPCHHELMQQLLQKGQVCWINPDINHVYQRVHSDQTRPLKSDLDSFRLLYFERSEIFKLAEFQTQVQDLQEAVEAIIHWLNKNPS
ncbi:MAG: hypothetical protein RLZZ301_1343 [Bacteroidota bacterium]